MSSWYTPYAHLIPSIICSKHIRWTETFKNQKKMQSRVTLYMFLLHKLVKTFITVPYFLLKCLNWHGKSDPAIIIKALSRIDCFSIPSFAILYKIDFTIVFYSSRWMTFVDFSTCERTMKKIICSGYSAVFVCVCVLTSQSKPKWNYTFIILCYRYSYNVQCTYVTTLNRTISCESIINYSCFNPFHQQLLHVPLIFPP